MYIIPVGIPGLGKSTLLRALKNLDSDSIYISADKCKTKKKFLDEIKANKVVYPDKNLIIDRNNHTGDSRMELKSILNEDKMIYVKFIPENYSMSEIQKIARERIKQRGSHHELVKDATKGQKIVRWLAMKYEDPDFENSIDLPPENSIKENLKILLEHLYINASDSEINLAIEKSLKYEIEL